jgi:hypothetical protein
VDEEGTGGTSGVALEETSPRENASEGAPRRKLSRVAMMKTTVPCANDRSRRSWRTAGGTVETGVESGCRAS